MAKKQQHKIGDVCEVRPEWLGRTSDPELQNIRVKIIAEQKNGNQTFYKVRWNETDKHLESNYGFLFTAKELV